MEQTTAISVGIRIILNAAQKAGVRMGEAAGLSQEELAHRLKTKKTAILRIENRAEDIKLSTLKRVAVALGNHLKVSIA